VSKSHPIAEPGGDPQSHRAPVDQRDDAPEAPVQQVFLTRREAREAERRAAAGASTVAVDETLAGVASTAEAPVVAESAVVSVPRVEAAVADVSAPTTPSASSASRQAVDAAPVHATRAARRAAEAEAARGRTRRSASAAAAGTVAPAAPRSGRSTARAEQRVSAPTSRRPARPAPTASASTPAPARRQRQGISFGGAGKRVTVVGAMMFAGAMLVATSVPANAFFVDTDERTVAKKAAAAQTFVAGAAAEDAATRDGYSVTEMKVAPVSEYASTSSSTFTNDVAGTVQWPFATGVPISSGFGARHVSNCGFCSTFHNGLDFVPGSGSPIQAIADGTVSAVTGPGGAFGNHVEIEHVIDGQKVTSTYSHMQTGSVQVSVGETVTVGQLVGKVGSTGNSTGAHLHFEIHLGGVPVDPYPWLTANTN
jgi:murein DD-endopeptidase MepM/ murein hydrolase activator NlpD